MKPLSQSKQEELDTVERLRSLVTGDVTAVRLLVQYGELDAESRRLDKARIRAHARYRGKKVKRAEALAKITHEKLLVHDAVREVVARGRAHCRRLDTLSEDLQCDSDLVDDFLKSMNLPETLPVLQLTGSFWRKALGIGQ
jgi:hypothetical protein